MIISIIGCVDGRVDDAWIARVALEIGDPINLIGIYLRHPWVTHHHRVVMIQFTEQVSISWIHRATRGILASCNSRGWAIHGIGGVGHLQQFAIGAVVLLALQLACASRIQVPVRGRMTGRGGITGNAAGGKAPAGSRGKGVGLRRVVRIDHLRAGKAGELPIVVVGVVIIVLVAPVVTLQTITTGLGRERVEIILVGPLRTDSVGLLHALGEHDPAPVLIIGLPTQTRRRLRTRSVTGKGVVAHAPMGVVMCLLPTHRHMPAHPIVERRQVIAVVRLLPQHTSICIGGRPGGAAGTLGVGLMILIHIVLRLLGIAHCGYRCVDQMPVSIQLLNLRQVQIPGGTLVLPTIRVNDRLRPCLIVGQSILAQQVPIDLYLDVIEHIRTLRIGNGQSSRPGEIHRVVTAEGGRGPGRATRRIGRVGHFRG